MSCNTCYDYVSHLRTGLRDSILPPRDWARHIIRFYPDLAAEIVNLSENDGRRRRLPDRIENAPSSPVDVVYQRVDPPFTAQYREAARNEERNRAPIPIPYAVSPPRPNGGWNDAADDGWGMLIDDRNPTPTVALPTPSTSRASAFQSTSALPSQAEVVRKANRRTKPLPTQKKGYIWVHNISIPDWSNAECSFEMLANSTLLEKMLTMYLNNPDSSRTAVADKFYECIESRLGFGRAIARPCIWHPRMHRDLLLWETRHYEVPEGQPSKPDARPPPPAVRLEGEKTTANQRAVAGCARIQRRLFQIDCEMAYIQIHETTVYAAVQAAMTADMGNDSIYYLKWMKELAYKFEGTDHLSLIDRTLDAGTKIPNAFDRRQSSEFCWTHLRIRNEHQILEIRRYIERDIAAQNGELIPRPITPATPASNTAAPSIELMEGVEIEQHVGNSSTSPVDESRDRMANLGLQDNETPFVTPEDSISSSTPAVIAPAPGPGYPHDIPNLPASANYRGLLDDLVQKGVRFRVIPDHVRQDTEGNPAHYALVEVAAPHIKPTFCPADGRYYGRVIRVRHLLRSPSAKLKSIDCYAEMEDEEDYGSSGAEMRAIDSDDPRASPECVADRYDDSKRTISGVDFWYGSAFLTRRGFRAPHISLATEERWEYLEFPGYPKNHRLALRRIKTDCMKLEHFVKQRSELPPPPRILDEWRVDMGYYPVIDSRCTTERVALSEPTGWTADENTRWEQTNPNETVYWVRPRSIKGQQVVDIVWNPSSDE